MIFTVYTNQTGQSPTINIFDVISTEKVVEDTMHEVGGGWYKHTFETADSSKFYVASATIGTSLFVAHPYIPNNLSVKERLSNIETTITNTNTLIAEIWAGVLGSHLKDGNELVFKNAFNEIIATYSLVFDAEGNLIARTKI